MPRSTDPGKLPERPRPTPAGAGVRANILDAMAAARANMTPLALQRQLCKALGYDRFEVRAALADLVAEGELNYLYEAGRTTLELAFNRPVRVAGRICLVPEGHLLPAEEDKVPVVIRQGAAFGDGRHPSTRLALTGIEWIADEVFRFQDKRAATVLDVGTGSGVLLVAGLKLGFGSGLGIDTDPCAVSEAGANIRLNGLAGRAAVSLHGIEKLDRSYDLICANLRWPTLTSIRDAIKRRLRPGGALLVSGVRSTELTALSAWYAKAGFASRWQSVRMDWAAAALQPQA